MGCPHKKKLYLRKRHSFVIEKYVEDVKQDQKIVRDVVESIMKPPDPVKEELRRMLMNMCQFRHEITRIKDSTFWMSRKLTDRRWRSTQRASPASFKSITASQTQTNRQIFKNRVYVKEGPYPSS